MVVSPHHFIKRELIARVPSIHHEHKSYKWWILANVMIGTFIAVLDATIVNVGLPKITASLGTSLDSAEWVLTAYMLVFGIVLPASGWVADHLGYKRTYFTALFLFTLGSFLCGLAQSEAFLITSRIIQGVGAGFLMPTGMAIVMREFPVNQRGLAIGFWGVAAAASVSFGPLIGGYLVDNFSWQSMFYVNVPIGLCGMLVTLIIQREYKTEYIRSFDFMGFLSMTVFLTFLLLALSEGNASWNTGGWTSPFIMLCFALAFVGFVVFLAVELNTEHPFVELRLFSDLNFTISNIVLFIFGLAMFGSTFLLPLYLQNSLGYTAIESGAVFLPVGILQGIMGPVAGTMSDRMNPKIPIAIGIILLAASMYFNIFLSLFSEHSQIMMPLYLRGFAMGLLFAPLATVSLANIPKQKIAQASGLFNVIRQIGGSFGVAIFGTILTRRSLFHATIYGESVNRYSATFQNITANLRHFAQAAAGSSPGEAVARAQALIASHIGQQAFVNAVDDCFFTAAAVSIVAIVPILFLRSSKNKGPEKISA